MESTGSGLTECKRQTRLQWFQLLGADQADGAVTQTAGSMKGLGLLGKVAGRPVTKRGVRPLKFEVTVQYLRLRGSNGS